MIGFSWLRPRPESKTPSVPVHAVIPPLRELAPLYESELRRARRYERPLSVMLLALDGAGAQQAQQCVRLGELLQDVLRETDLLSHIPATEDFVVLLPEANSVAADEAGERLRRLWSLQHGVVDLNYGTAAYPAAGLVLDDLISAARRALREAQNSQLARSANA